MVSSLQSFATISDFKFDVNYQFTLYPEGKTGFVEYKNTRLSKGTLDVDLIIASQKESHQVKLGVKDLKRPTNLLKINKKKSRLSFMGKSHKLSLNKVYKTPNSFKKLGEDDLSITLKNIDKDIALKTFERKLIKDSLICRPSKKYLLCEVNLTYQGSKKQNKTKLSELKGHLFDLKNEMSNNTLENYDIQGYREFLTKAESLLDESLNTKVSNKKDKLLAVKDLLINERIDSYEYTAIRSKSISEFVNLLISKI